MKKKYLYISTCVLGSGMVGFFANGLNEIYECILFSFGIALMVYSIIKLNR